MEGTDFDRIMALCGEMEMEMEPEAIREEEGEGGTKLRIHTERGKKIFDKRRFSSEKALMDAMDWYWHPGEIHHVLTGGDVDFLSFLRFALRQQPAEYMLISSWCYGVEDVAEIASWVERGYVKRLDAYMGEIAAASYVMCQEELAQAAGKTGGRVGVFRNHSKVGVILGPRFSCAIASSANVNTNPRCENTTITCDLDVALWYKAYFDGIKPFNGSPEGWRPYEAYGKESAL